MIKENEIVEFYDAMLPTMQKYDAGNNRRLNMVKHKLGGLVYSGARVLDIGCGTGITSKRMAELGASVLGVDISPALIKHAQKVSNHKNIEWLVGDICELKCKEKFDIIVFVDSFEHILPSKIQQLIESLVSNNAHKQTVFYINIPNYNYLKFIIENRPEKLQIIDEPYDVCDMLTIFRSVGFEFFYINTPGIDYVEYGFQDKSFLNEKLMRGSYGC